MAVPAEITKIRGERHVAAERDERRHAVSGPTSDAHVRARDLAAARLDWGLSGAETEGFARHIATCPACRRYAASLIADAALLEALPESDAPAGVHLRLWTQLREPR